ncbi:uroporphyrinogen decarboxylase family protein [Patulibacter defluvii]|uniref:uroporphyrinogen decarboxylase family protein n=1 Tax=Patulibacter defluvii TaxID=3095358 RepID=UPI002A7621CF|nr:uroporphyrinogen decarboxylase family protein [Patulibacter sp. DM4]
MSATSIGDRATTVPVTGGARFAPRAAGFGARVLGIAPEEARTTPAAAIQCCRQERDLLRPDLTVVAADGTLLAEALGCSIARTGQGGWRVGASADPEAAIDRAEDPDVLRTPAIGAALAAIEALAPEGEVALLLRSPLCVASVVLGRPLRLETGADDELIDACCLVATDLAKQALDRDAAVVLEEGAAPPPEALDLYAPLLKMLAHRGRPASVLVHGSRAGAFADPPPGVGAVVTRAALSDWGQEWQPDPAQALFAPRISPAASPERVQLLRAGLDREDGR